jgi:hypothetical protein
MSRVKTLTRIREKFLETDNSNTLALINFVDSAP